MIPPLASASAFVGASVSTIMASKAALTVVGFTKTGIAAGSWAASWMSSAAIANGGGVAAGSTVSLLQHASMVGAAGIVTGPVGAAVLTGAVAVGTVAAVVTLI